MFRKAILGAVALALLVGCKKYDTPEYWEIQPHETAFVIPFEGDIGAQVKFASEESLKKLMVASKRIRVPHRWNQTGRAWFSGSWIPTVRVITVDRTPITREWSASIAIGTKAKDEAIWAESRDSVGFSTGISITAMVHENDSARFLYLYPSRDVPGVLDTEARARVQKALSDFAAQYDMSELREKKNEMMDMVRKDIKEFYADRGLTVTTIAQFGGFTYENAKIQDAIDAVFMAQREKEVAKAQLEAQNDKNRRVIIEAQAVGDSERQKAQGIADGKRAIVDVAKEAASNPVFLELQRIELERARVERWNGQYPTYYFSTGSSPMMMIQAPALK